MRIYPKTLRLPSRWQPTKPRRLPTNLIGNHPRERQRFLDRSTTGQYLFVRIRMKGIAGSTPMLRRIRIDFHALPASMNYQLSTARILRRRISRSGFCRFLMRPSRTWIERLNGFPPCSILWVYPKKCCLGSVHCWGWLLIRNRLLNCDELYLQAAPELYRLRGTLAGLKLAIKLFYGSKWITDTAPVIQEQAFRRAWGVVNHNARLGAVRLFGKSEARLRVGRSGLGNAPLRSYGNPEHDPVRTDAHQFVVLMPPVQT